jgi:hypothetical protein
MNAHQRRVEKRESIKKVELLIKNDPKNHDAIYRAIRKLRFDDLVALGAVRFELTSKLTVTTNDTP